MNKFRLVAGLAFVLSLSSVYQLILIALEHYTDYGRLDIPVRFTVGIMGSILIGWYGTKWFHRKWPLYGGKK